MRPTDAMFHDVTSMEGHCMLTCVFAHSFIRSHPVIDLPGLMIAVVTQEIAGRAAVQNGVGLPHAALPLGRACAAEL